MKVTKLKHPHTHTYTGRGKEAAGAIHHGPSKISLKLVHGAYALGRRGEAAKGGAE